MNAKKVLHAIAMTKEDRRSISTTDDGVLSFGTFFSERTVIFSEAAPLLFSEETKILLKHIRKIRNTMEVSAVKVAIRRGLSNPWTA